jgi:hypothetical protein
VRESKSIYTHTIICRAKEAYEFLRHVACPYPEDAIYLLQDENVFGLQYLKHEDLSWAYYDISTCAICMENQARR